MTFGEKVKQIRIRQGLSQFQLGEKMRISQQAIAKYERLTEQPKLTTIRKLADALEVSISELTIDWSEFSPGELWEDMQDNEVDYTALDPRQAVNDSRLLNNYHKLNYAGQEKAIEQLKMLTKIPEYRKEND